MDIKTPSHLAYVATLPCEALMSAKQAINDKLQGVVGLLIIKLRKFIAECLSEKMFKIGEYLAKLQARK